MSEEKRWKRGDIGPDGRVFYKYDEGCKNGQRWTTPEKLEQIKEKEQIYLVKNKEKKANRERIYRQKNKEKRANYRLDYYKQNKEKIRDKSKQWSVKNKEKREDIITRWKSENKERLCELNRRCKVRKFFRAANPKDIEEFYKVIEINAGRKMSTIFRLTPDEGQTLAELIHELSGYPMELCEQIANPPEPEPEPQPEMLDNSPPPVILPDLF